jgi:hypothetical protein
MGGEVSLFDAVDVSEDNEESGESATDLDADDSAGRLLRELGHSAGSCGTTVSTARTVLADASGCIWTEMI